MKTQISSFLLLILIAIAPTYAQKNYDQPQIADSIPVKRLSIGLNIGIPNVVGGTAEIVLPFFNNHFAPFVDYSKIDMTVDDVDTQFSYIAYGIHFYPSKKGRGFYISAGKSAFSSDITFNNLSFGQGIVGTAGVPLDLNTTDFKLGIKTGGRLFFKFDLGYGLGDIPKSLHFTATANGLTKNFSEDIPPLPGIGSNGILLGSFGFGFSF